MYLLLTIVMAARGINLHSKTEYMSDTKGDEDSSPICFGTCFKTKACGGRCFAIKFKNRFDNAICCLLTCMVISLLIGIIVPMVLNDIIQTSIQEEVVIDSTSAKNYESWQTNTVYDLLLQKNYTFIYFCGLFIWFRLALVKIYPSLMIFTSLTTKM